MRNFKNNLMQEKDYIQNIVQDRLWQCKYANKSESYPLFLFFDDFETGNALGNHAGNKKMGGVYVSLGFLPPHIAAKLKNCFF